MLKRGLGKNASGHLEMIFAFVFFVGFVFFMLRIISPYDEEVLPDSVLNGLVREFEEQYSTNLTSFFLKINYTGQNIASPCFFIQLPSQEFFGYDLSEVNSKAVNALSETPVSSQWVSTGAPSATHSGMLRLDKTVENYRIMFSPEFDESTMNGCGNELVDTQFEIGNLLERKVISYSKLQEMKTKYDTNYDSLKTGLGISASNDFSIISPELSELNMEKAAPFSVDVLTQNYIFEVLKSDGTIINARFVIGVW